MRKFSPRHQKREPNEEVHRAEALPRLRRAGETAKRSQERVGKSDRRRTPTEKPGLERIRTREAAGTKMTHSSTSESDTKNKFRVIATAHRRAHIDGRRDEGGVRDHPERPRRVAVFTRDKRGRRIGRARADPNRAPSRQAPRKQPLPRHGGSDLPGSVSRIIRPTETVNASKEEGEK